ncbi:MAG: hypothetical protein ACK4K2_00860 [Dehalococcoidia bacterium]
MAAGPLPLWRRLRPLGAWPAMALLVALGLVAYNALLGMRWWSGSQQVASLAIQARQGVGVAPPHTPNAEERAREVAERERQWRQAVQPFLLATPEDLVQALVTAAKEAGVSLTSVALGDTQSNSLEGVQYVAQPVTLGLRGEPAALSGFLSRLGMHLPNSALVSASFSDIAQSPAAHLQLMVYLSPQPTQGKGGR